MKALIAPCGTYGDIAAPLALALRLREMGFEVRTASSENFRSLFEAKGFEFHPVGLDFRNELREDADAQRTGSRAQLLAWGKLIKREVKLQSEELPDLAADVNIVVGSGLLFFGRSVADYHVPTAIPRSAKSPRDTIAQGTGNRRWRAS